MAASDSANEARLAAAAKAAETAAKTAADKQAAIDAATAATIAAGGKSTDPANRLPGETASQANARITAAYKAQPKPELTQEGAAAGATIEWVRTGAGGVGEYKEVFPIGTPIPATRTTTSGNVYDAQGNLVSGTGVKTTGTSTKTITSTVVNADGSKTITYSDGTKANVPKTTSVVTPTSDKPVGTPPAYVLNPATGKWEMPAKPTSAGTWVFDNNNGWVNTTINPGSTGFSAGSDKTLALDTFKNTLALLFGAKEASQPWVTALYSTATKFYNTGSTIDEAINLSLQDVRNNKDLTAFTSRFKGIYALTDRLAKGEAIEVPTIAEYFKSESSMGDVLRAAGMGDIATQEFLGDVIGRGKSVLEVTNLIQDTFDRIDNAPTALKNDLQTYFPGADRTSIAKALLTGEEGAAALNKKIAGITALSAAKTQGVNIDLATGTDIAMQGYDYNKSLEKFATVKQLERGQTLGKMSGIDLTQQEAIASTFGSNAAADEKIRRIKEEEALRFSGSSGKFASKSRAQGLI